MARAIWDALADRDVFVMFGAIMNAPNRFRISLTASDAMVERALPAFADVRGDESALWIAMLPVNPTDCYRSRRSRIHLGNVR